MKFFLNDASQCFYECSGTCTTEKKRFSSRKKLNRYFFSFTCLICDFSQKFSFYNSVWIRIRIQIRIRTFFRIRIRAKLTDYFKFGSTTLAPTLTFGALEEQKKSLSDQLRKNDQIRQHLF
jgi:hypothetical protein